ncbi:MAG: phosphoribosyltransferase [Aquisalimonadaceae bacterium]
MAEEVFMDRVEAGRLLGDRLRLKYGKLSDALILALPRGGVPVAYEVARKLELPLDLVLVRKLGLPGHEELAMGAIASGGAIVLNTELLSHLPVSAATIDHVTSQERRELARRERAYRGDRPQPRITNRTAILVDDGLATGSTMRAAIAAVRQADPEQVIVAVPVAPPDTVDALANEADDVIALRTPASFLGVGHWYREFPQTSDDEVRGLLARVWSKQPEVT